MPPLTSYRPTEPPDSPVNDSDSDVDLDLEELDPSTSSHAQASRLLGHNQSPEQRAPRIALRNIRMGGLRRSGNRGRGYGELGHGRDGINDAVGLLEDDSQGQRYSDGSQNAGDEAPLLDEHASHTRRSFASDRLQNLEIGRAHV